MLKLLQKYARDEATDCLVYSRLASSAKRDEVRKTLKQLAEQELKHYRFWLSLLGIDSIKPSSIKVLLYLFLNLIFGSTFVARLLEDGEHRTIKRYEELLLGGAVPEERRSGVEEIVREELSHEDLLLNLVEDERVRYMGSVVLGLNDALVELTGALAGLTSAFPSTLLIGFSGLIVGISAAISMAASNYLSVEAANNRGSSPSKAAIYTGISYIVTVFLLVLPFLLLSERFVALALSLAIATLIIGTFSYYSSIVSRAPFRARLGKMLLLGLGVAAVTYLLSRLIGTFLGINIY